MSCCSVAEVGYRGRTIRLPCAVSAFANTPHGRVIPGLQHVIAASKSFTMLGYHTFSRTVRGFGRENLEADFYWRGLCIANLSMLNRDFWTLRFEFDVLNSHA